MDNLQGSDRTWGVTQGDVLMTLPSSILFCPQGAREMRKGCLVFGLFQTPEAMSLGALPALGAGALRRGMEWVRTPGLERRTLADGVLGRKGGRYMEYNVECSSYVLEQTGTSSLS